MSLELLYIPYFNSSYYVVNVKNSKADSAQGRTGDVLRVKQMP